jgi:hypothetical protein
MFNTTIMLQVVKRGRTTKDNENIKNVRIDIFENNLTVNDLINKYNIKTVNHIKDLRSAKNLSYFKKTRHQVNQYFQKKLYGDTKLRAGLVMICKEHMYRPNQNKEKKKLIVNYTYKIENIEKNKITMKDEETNDLFVFKQDEIYEKFDWNYCITIVSSQGTTIDETVGLFNLDTAYIMKEELYVALTRNKSLDDITIVLSSKDERNALNHCRIKQYFEMKIENYKKQDKVANREVDNDKFVTYKWITDKLKCSVKCGRCHEAMDLPTLIDGKVVSNITVDRADNSQPHHQDNCFLSCHLCNVSASNRHTITISVPIVEQIEYIEEPIIMNVNSNYQQEDYIDELDL